MVVICLLGYNLRASRVRRKERVRQQWETWVSEMHWMWNLVTSLVLSEARIIIIERFAKSIISGCRVDGWVWERCGVDVSFCLRWQDWRCWMTVSWPATLCTHADDCWLTDGLSGNLNESLLQRLAYRLTGLPACSFYCVISHPITPCYSLFCVSYQISILPAS